MTPQLENKPFLHENKTQALTRHLADMAVEMGPGAKFPTVAQLCSSLGVSIMTLNRALSELEARGLILRRHAVGIFVTQRAAQKTIGLITTLDVSDNGLSPFWTVLLQASRERAQALNEKVRFYMAIPGAGAAAAPDDLVEDVEAGRLHGVVALGLHDPLHEWLLARGIPAVEFGGGGILPARVTLDPAVEIELGVRAMAERGCRNIGLWATEPSGASHYAPAPFRRALEAASLEYRPELYHIVDCDICHYQSSGQDLALQVFGATGTSTRPDGLLILDDMMTRGALTAFHRLGLHAGEDVLIATHANKNSAVLHGYESGLIRLEFDPAELVAAMFELLDAQIKGQPLPDQLPLVKPHLLLPTARP